MLAFTAAGAVATPTTLQVRVTLDHPGRVAAGAPRPPRTLADDEVLANVEHFTVLRRGPRTAPCTGLVLAGVDLHGRPGLAGVVDRARAWGVTRVTLHLSRGERRALAASPLARRVDAVALVVRDAHDLADVAALPRVTAVVLLDEPGLHRLGSLAAGLAGARPDRVVFTWPLHGSRPPPHARRVAEALRSAFAPLDAAGVPAGVKGLPLCVLGAEARPRLWRSANRYYVDAAHQRDRALLFFPDVVRFEKGDVCRFCVASQACDGAPAAWMERGLTGPLEPVEAA